MPASGTAGPTVHRSETVKEFLDRSNIQRNQKSLIQQALDRTAAEAGTNATPQDQKLVEWSKRTGLSVETLKLIQAKSDVIQEQRSELNRTMVQHESSQKRYQQITKLADMIRTQFTLKMKWTLPLREVIQGLNDSQRGQFQSQGRLY